jgi:hypothetical protein
MRHFVLAGSAVLALIVVPVLAASVAHGQSRGKDNPNHGYCKSGERVKDMKACKENGGKK